MTELLQEPSVPVPVFTKGFRAKGFRALAEDSECAIWGHLRVRGQSLMFADGQTLLAQGAVSAMALHGPASGIQTAGHDHSAIQIHGNNMSAL